MLVTRRPLILPALIKALERGEISSAFDLAQELRWIGTYAQAPTPLVDLSSVSLNLLPILSHRDIEELHAAATLAHVEKLNSEEGAAALTTHFVYALCFREALITKLKTLCPED